MLLTLRYREATGYASTALVHARRPAVDNSSARIEVDHEPRAVNLVLLAVELHIADERDELAVKIVDSKVALGRFSRALDDHAARRVESADLDVVVAALATSRISDGQSGCIKRQFGLNDVNVPRENRSIGAILDLDAVGGDIDRSVAVVTLERRNRLLLPDLRERSASGVSHGM